MTAPLALPAVVKRHKVFLIVGGQYDSEARGRGEMEFIRQTCYPDLRR